MNEVIYSWDSLPLVLGVEDVRQVIKGNSNTLPSKDTIYQMMNSNGFPLIKGAKELKVSKDGLKQWLTTLH